jgi:hypothetical protein
VEVVVVAEVTLTVVVLVELKIKVMTMVMDILTVVVVVTNIFFLKRYDFLPECIITFGQNYFLGLCILTLKNGFIKIN